MPSVQEIALLFNGMFAFPVIFSILQYFHDRCNRYQLYFFFYTATLFFIFLDINYPVWPNAFIRTLVYALSTLSYFFFIDDFLRISGRSATFGRLFKWIKVLIYVFCLFLAVAYGITRGNPSLNSTLKSILFDLEDLFFLSILLFGIYSLAIIFFFRDLLSRYIFWGTILLATGLALNRMLGEDIFGAYSSAWEVLPYEAGTFLELVLFSSAIAFKSKQAVREKDLAEQDLQKARLIMLRDQMSPHFIANCINSAKALIQQGKNKEAIAYLVEFSSLFRLVFVHFTKMKIPLHKELEICRHYVEMEKLRLGTEFHCDIRICIGPDLLSFLEVPPLIIQPFVENAIWHGLKEKRGEKRLLIAIKPANGVVKLLIEDNGVGRSQAIPGADSMVSTTNSNSSSNIRKRLRIFEELYDQAIRLEIIDLTDEAGKPKGTSVEFSIAIS